MYSLSTCWNSGRHTCGRQMLREIRDLGFGYAELSHGIRISLVPGIIEALDAGEIRISTLHNFCPLPMGVNWPAPNLFKFSSDDGRERASALKHTLKTLDMAQRVGARLVVLHCGEVPMRDYNDKLETLVARGDRETPRYRRLVEEVEERRERSKEQAQELSLELIERIAGEAATRGLLLGVENREAVEEIPFDHELALFLARLPENVRYWHDCGHAQIKENLGFIHHAMHLEELAPRLAGFHVHDVIADAEGQHDHCPPGSGMVDFRTLRSFVRPDHIKVIELSPGVSADDVRRGYEFLRSVWGDE
ncbi:MAG: sugar phosphate isomerase/epimerase [Verrucomicrobiae bacterium]|nr:sugar phosphate isomerase/epimerase [Verrucomicrobiae bacterium]